MTTILLSIKSEYVRRIFSGEKKFEYRKRIPKKEIERIVIYETSPKKRIVGVAEVSGIVSDSPICLWNDTYKNSGISKKAYISYFSDSNEAFAFVLGKITKLKKEYLLSEVGINQAPQSFVYLDEKQITILE